MEDAMMINRGKILDKIRKAFKSFKIVCLLGPRQSGKTTIARSIKEEYPKVHYFDLEDIEDLKNISLNNSLDELRGMIIIDEIQTRPELFVYLKKLKDKKLDQKFLILGSASVELIKKASDSLTGRIVFIEITPFSLSEVKDLERLWIQGGFPGSYLEEWPESLEWIDNYKETYIYKDLAFGYTINFIRGFWVLLAHYHGQVVDYANLANALKTSRDNIARYIDLLEASFILRVLRPFKNNLQKVQVKNPKIYYRDSGFFHHALGIQLEKDVFKHGKIGASFEGFAMEEVIRVHSAK